MTMLETERLILRPFEGQDLDFLDILHGDEKVMRYILGRTRSHEENIVYLDRLLEWEEMLGIGQRLVIRKEDNRSVGRCGISLFYGTEKAGITSYQPIPETSDALRVYELGYTFLQQEWGKGYASEAAAAMRDYSLNIQKLPEVHSIIMQKNTGSITVAEKIGAVRFGECFCFGNLSWDYISRLSTNEVSI